MDNLANGDALLTPAIPWVLARRALTAPRAVFAILKHIELIQQNVATEDLLCSRTALQEFHLSQNEMQVLDFAAVYISGFVRRSWGDEQLRQQGTTYEAVLADFSSVLDLPIVKSNERLRLRAVMNRLEFQIKNGKGPSALEQTGLVDQFTNSDSMVDAAIDLFPLVASCGLQDWDGSSYSDRSRLADILLRLLEWIAGCVSTCKHCRMLVDFLARRVNEIAPRLEEAGLIEAAGRLAGVAATLLDTTSSGRFHRASTRIHCHIYAAQRLMATLQLRQAKEHLDAAQALTSGGRFVARALKSEGNRLLAQHALMVGDPAFAIRALRAVRPAGNLLAITNMTIIKAAAMCNDREQAIRAMKVIFEIMADPTRDSDVEFYGTHGDRYATAVDERCQAALAFAEWMILESRFWAALQYSESALHNARGNCMYAFARYRITYVESLLRCAEYSLAVNQQKLAHKYSVGVLTALHEGQRLEDIPSQHSDLILQGLSVHTESALAWGNIEAATELAQRATELKLTLEKRGASLPRLSALKVLRAQVMVGAAAGTVEDAIEGFDELCGQLRAMPCPLEGTFGVWRYATEARVLSV